MKTILVFSVVVAITFSCFTSSRENPDMSQPFGDNGLLAMVKKGNKYGYINTNNEAVIPFVYDQATTFSEGLACVKKGRYWMFINTKNEVVIDRLEIEYPTRFSNGMARLHMGFGNMRYMNRQGNLSPESFALLNEFHNGLARATSNDRVPYGYIDKNGEWVIGYNGNMPDELGEFIEPITSYRDYSDIYFDPYQKSNPLLLFAFMDTTGRQVTELKYGNVGSFNNGLCRVSSHKRIPTWGYIDDQGNEVIPLKYKDARDFNDGVAAVKSSNWMIIDKSGAVLFEHQWASSLVFSEGLASIWSESAPRKKGYVNKAGEIEVEHQFAEAFEFKNGFAIVQMNGKMGFIDRTGRIIIGAQYDRADNFVLPHQTNKFQQIN